MTRLNTKEKRINLRNAWIDSDIKKGYVREDYKSAIILTNTKADENGKFYFKAYTGTRSNHDIFYSFKSLESLNEYLTKYKKTIDSREEWEKERKLKNKGCKSNQAAAAKAIKEELKKAYPKTKFSVTSSGFSMGDSVHIKWTDGAAVKEVEKITNKYQYGHFNGMEDIYECSNRREDIPQSKYVSCSRSISEELENLFVNVYKDFAPDGIGEYDHNSPKQVAYRFWHKTTIPEGATNLKVVKNDKKSGLGFEDFYSLVCDVPQKKESKKEPLNLEKIEVKKGEINIIEYSSKSIAVIGDTKPIKDKLKALGGKFNFRLSCGAGWIFPASKLEEIQNALTTKEEPKKEEKNEFMHIVKDDIKTFDSLQEMRKAVKEGEQISLFNLSQLVNQ